MVQGKFIVVEGIEGSGKSTLIKRLETKLTLAGQDHIITREPGATSIGKQIRELLLNEHEEEMDFKTELLLFFADRAQHINEIIKPSLEANKLIICDRYYYSTLAYQHYGRGIPKELVNNLITMVAAEYLPDLVLLVDIDPEVALTRAKSRAKLDRIEKEDLAFHSRIRRGFLELAKEDAQRFLILDGTKSESDLEEEAFARICKIISR